MAHRVVGEILEESEFIPRKRLRDHLDPLDGLSEVEIYDKYRFPSPIILEIVDIIREDIDRPTQRNMPLNSIRQICCTLRYLSSNSFQSVIGDTIGVSKATINRSIWRVLRALVAHCETFIKFPDKEQLSVIKRNFYDKYKFPNVIGLIDGTHVRIIVPKAVEYVFINRKNFHPINVQAVCDHTGSFINIVAKWPGSAHDARIFEESQLQNLLRTIEDGFLLGDSGYPCSTTLLTPYLKPRNDGQQKYNNSLKRARVLIEQVFGQWKRRFSILHGEVRVNYLCLPMLIMCCAMLHNIAVKHKLPTFHADEFTCDDDNDQYDQCDQSVNEGSRFRDFIVEQHFL